MRICILSLFLLTGALVRAQDVTGIWRGHFRSNESASEFYQRFTGLDDRYKMEVQIAQQNNTFKAVTYSYKSTVFYGKATANGSVNRKDQKVLLKEIKIVEVRMMAGDACTMTCDMRYSKLGGEEFLEGTYTSVNTRDGSDCGKGTIFLRKVPNSDFYKEPFLKRREEEIAGKKDKPHVDTLQAKKISPTKVSPPLASSNKPKTGTKPAPVAKKSVPVAKTATQSTTATKKEEKSLTKKNLDQHKIESIRKDSVITVDKKIIPIPLPAELAGRTNELVKTITVNTQDVQLNIYDDGVVDNDTVSVYFDNKLIIQNARLTTQPLIAKIHLDDTSPTHEVVMVAENLGEIPPNTSLMVVRAGEKRFEVRIVSTEQKNAVIVFKYEKPE
jgi:hypothetical protein